MAHEPPIPWHTLTSAQACERFSVDPALGLDEREAQRRLSEHGANAFADPPARSVLQALAAQFRDVLVLVLLGAALIAFATGDATDGALVLVIVALDATLGCVQELRADRAVRSLRNMLPTYANVRRGGQSHRVEASAIVPGDVVLLEAGAIVPADVRLFAAHALATQEAALTGESQPVDKQSMSEHEASAPIAERSNMAWKGTIVVRGRGEGIAVATGMRAELGRIASLLDNARQPLTPLQLRLASFGRRVSACVLLVATLLFLLGWARGEPLQPLLLLVVSIAVAAIPEALPAVVTIALALAARRMAHRHALARTLPSVETLGAVTFVCVDKTGTLTENRMRARAFAYGGATHSAMPQWNKADEHARSLLRALALCHDATRHENGFLGDPTETALADVAHECGAEPQRMLQEWRRVGELPFDSALQRMTTLHQARDGRWVALTKGSPEAVLPLCALDPTQLTQILDEARAFAATGKRVLAFAERTGNGALPSLASCVESMRFLGLCALLDPPRSGAREAIEACRRAGIVTVMITGDHPATARSVANELALLDDAGLVITGRELDAMDDSELDRAMGVAREHGLVFARTSPEQKIRIVTSLQRRGEVVAMTGDGVNDAPALRKADIGVAMGMRGTDVAREASDLALLDDDFATIPAAVEEGRRMHDSVRRFVRFLMAGNSAEILVVATAMLLGLPQPLLPAHILWINLVTDGLPSILLANEPSDPRAMLRPPRPKDEGLFARGSLRHVLVFGALMALLALAAMAMAAHDGVERQRTLVFTTLVCCQLAHALAVRSERDSLFGRAFFGNAPLLLAVALSAATQLALVYAPFANRWLHTAPLDPFAFVFVFAAAACVVLGVELEKAALRRRDRITTTSRTRSTEHPR